VNSVSWLVPLPVLLPLVGAGITLAAARRTQVQRFVSMTVLTAVVACPATCSSPPTVRARR